MKEEKKLPFWLGLIVISGRAYILWTAMVLILSWYVYYVLQLSKDNVEGGGYLYLTMVLLSIFGLFQLIELAAKILKLKDGPSQVAQSESRSDA